MGKAKGKTYTDRGYIVVEDGYAIIFNEEPFKGYRWYTEDGKNYLGVRADPDTMEIIHCTNKMLTLSYYWNGIWRK